jgi:protocatechuate 3,4-dioxygenase alpha subunit
MPGSTPSQTVGPYFSLGLGERPHGDLVEPGSPGAIEISGAVRDGAGQPVPDAMIEIRQAEGCARAATTADGSFGFTTVKPDPPRGLDGVEQAPHIAVAVFARGLLRHLATRIYFPDEPAANARDPLLARLADPASLIARPEGDGLRFDIVLQGEGETVFLDV